MRLNLRYGEGFLPIENGTLSLMDHYQPRSVIGFQDIHNSILQAIENPIDSAPLSKLLSKADSLCFVVENIHDSYIQKITKSLISVLDKSLPSKKQISFVISTNIFNSSTVESMLDNPSQIGMNVEIHNSQLSNNLERIGYTPSYATPLYLNKTFLSSDLKIGIGAISPNILIGATGGRTAVLPGISGSDTVIANLKLQTVAPFNGYDVSSQPSKDMMEATDIVGLDFILNIIEDHTGNIASLAVGGPKKAWEIGAKACHNIASITPKKRYDIAVVCAGGSPHDKTLFDSMNSLYNGFQFTRHNGVIMLVAECPNGPGPDGFLTSINAANSEVEVQLFAQNGFAPGMELARVYWRILSKRKIVICSRLKPSTVEGKLRATSVRDPQEGFEIARQVTGTRSNIAVLQNSQCIIPKLD